MASVALELQQQTAVEKKELASEVLAAQAKALVQARYMVAIQRPRDMDQARQDLLKECKRPRFGETARYEVPRGKKKNKETGEWEDNFVRGFSIRFAEAAIRCMKNITVDTITIYDDTDRRIVRVTVTDLESNTPWAQDVTIQKAVERSKTKDGDVVLRTRLNSYGKTVYIIEATDDEILNKQNALISKAIRTLGLRLIPGDLLDEAEEEILQTQRAEDAKDPDAAKKKLLDAFGAIGISVSQLKEFLGHSLDTLDEKERQKLRGMYSALKEGEITWAEIMEGREAKADQKSSADTSKAQSITDRVKASREKSTPAPASSPDEKEARSGFEIIGWDTKQQDRFIEQYSSDWVKIRSEVSILVEKREAEK